MDKKLPSEIFGITFAKWLRTKYTSLAGVSNCLENISLTSISIQRVIIYSLEVDFIACFTILKKWYSANSFKDIFHKNKTAQNIYFNLFKQYCICSNVKINVANFKWST